MMALAFVLVAIALLELVLLVLNENERRFLELHVERLESELRAGHVTGPTSTPYPPDTWRTPSPDAIAPGFRWWLTSYRN